MCYRDILLDIIIHDNNRCKVVTLNDRVSAGRFHLLDPKFGFDRTRSCVGQNNTKKLKHTLQSLHNFLSSYL